MPIDYHTHSFRCGHATGAMNEYIDAAIDRGLDEIGLSDHLYLYFQPPEARSRQWAVAEEEYDEHYAAMLRLRRRYRSRLAVRVAVEADYVPSHEGELRAILDRYEFDYVLGGVHFLDDWMLDDVAESDRYRRERVADIYRRYYGVLLGAITSGMFDVIAHFDLPKKFGFVPEEDVRSAVDEVLDAASDCGVAIEVSSAGLRKPIGEVYPSASILAEIARRRIPIVLSSDAHAPDEVGHAYPRLLEELGRCGIDKVATFEGRRMVMRSIA